MTAYDELEGRVFDVLDHYHYQEACLRDSDASIDSTSLRDWVDTAYGALTDNDVDLIEGDGEYVREVVIEWYGSRARGGC